MIHTQSHNAVAPSGRARLAANWRSRADVAGVDRLEVNTGIDGVKAHAAVCMHAFPVNGAFWGYTQKTKTSHFQRWKVAL